MQSGNLFTDFKIKKTCKTELYDMGKKFII